MIELSPREGTCLVCNESRIVVEVRATRKVPYQGQSFCLRCLGHSILSFVKSDMESSGLKGRIDEGVDWDDPTSPPHRILRMAK